MLLACAVCALGGTGLEAQQPAPAADTVAPVAGDVIRLSIWQEPEMSGDFPVDENGIVVLPRIGRIDVRGETPASLERKLVEEYSKYLTHRSIDVTVLRRIQILGAVREPGVYPLDPTMTVADALAAAGGATPQGRTKSIELIRGGRRLPVDLYADLAASSVRSGDQLYVPERSWLSRNPGFVVGAVTGVLGLFIALSR